MKLKRSGRRMVTLGVVVCMLLSFLFVGLQPAFGQGTAAANTEEPPMPPEEPRISGTLEGTGTYFELTDSEYLNITVESTEPVHLMLESVPEMIVMHLEAAGEASSTVMSLGGFPASTTYYKYEDDYHNLVVFTTDDQGAYTYTQDLSEPHLVFIQPSAGTKFIRDDATGGDCASIGTWDPATKTCTLTSDVYETIQIDDDDLTLDGDSYTILGPGYGHGVYLYRRSGITIRNATVQHFSYGIRLTGSSNNTLSRNVASSNWCGIDLPGSRANTLSDNTVSSNGALGIRLTSSSDNTLTGNAALNNGNGVHLQQSSKNNTLTGNTVSSNSSDGIRLYYGCHHNSLTGNIVSSNRDGIYLYASGYNILTDNTVTSNSYYGIRLYYNSHRNMIVGNTIAWNYMGISLYYSCTENQVYNNNLIENSHQASVTYGCWGNVFNLDKPVGGNYWSNWTTPDADGDGFVDSPYVFTGGQDNLPWTRQNGWLDNAPPITSDVMADPNPASAGTVINLTATVDDSTTGNSSIASAEYSVDGGMTWESMSAADSAFDSPTEVVVGTTSLADAGVYDLCVRGTDARSNIGAEDCIFLVVYDPQGGFVTGGGWIWSPAGAYTPDPSLTGWASFGFVSKYMKGSAMPTGQTEFQYHWALSQGAELNFHSTSYEWLVVTGSDYARFKGSGTINGVGDYKFMLWAGDGDPDTFRVKIWYENDDMEEVVYDNGFDQSIDRGSIVIHGG